MFENFHLTKPQKESGRNLTGFRQKINLFNGMGEKKIRILVVFLRVKRWDLMNKTEISADMSYLVENIFVYFLQLVHQWPRQGGSLGACDPLSKPFFCRIK